MKVIRYIAQLAVVLSIAAPVAASATTYNALSDFSTSSNPNGVWSYASGTPTSNTLLGFAGTDFGPGYGFNYWGATADGLPAVGASGTPFGSVSVPSDELWMHPGANTGEDAIVLFTAPTTQLYTVDASFYHRDTAGTSGGNADGQIVGVYLNGVLLSDLLLGTNYGSSFTFNQVLALNAGDVIAFDVNKNGVYYNDSTGLKASISSTPEPSSLALLGTGTLGLVGFVRRRFKK